MKNRLLSLFILLFYCAFLIKVLIFKVVPPVTSGQVTLNFGGTNGGNPPNLIPFTTILQYLHGGSGVSIAYLNLVGNIALLIPVGFLVAYIYQHMTGKKALMVGVIAGLSIEVMQSLLNVGIFDIDDVILNALGVISGYYAFTYLKKWIHEKKYRYIGLAIFILIVAVVGSFYIIYSPGQS